MQKVNEFYLINHNQITSIVDLLLFICISYEQSENY